MPKEAFNSRVFYFVDMHRTWLSRVINNFTAWRSVCLRDIFCGSAFVRITRQYCVASAERSHYVNAERQSGHCSFSVGKTLDEMLVVSRPSGAECGAGGQEAVSGGHRYRPSYDRWAAWTSAHRGEWGEWPPGKMDEKWKGKTGRRERFSEWGGVGWSDTSDDWLLTTYLFRYTSKCTIL